MVSGSRSATWAEPLPAHSQPGRERSARATPTWAPVHPDKGVQAAQASPELRRPPFSPPVPPRLLLGDCMRGTPLLRL